MLYFHSICSTHLQGVQISLRNFVRPQPLTCPACVTLQRPQALFDVVFNRPLAVVKKGVSYMYNL